MHSRIFQISKTPLYKNDYISENYYYDHWFLHEIADYVDGDTDRAADISWLSKRDGIEVGHDDNGDFFIITSKKKYFAHSFERWKEACAKIYEMTIDHFIIYAMEHEMWTIKDAYDDKFGFYIEDCGEHYGTTTMDDLVRCCKDGDKFYIGATIDYHF